VKRTAVAIPVVIGSIIVPAMAAVDEQTTRLLSRWTPIAGFAIQHTVDRPDYYIAPWAGLAVMASYAGLAVAAGLVVTHRRDV
jgi:ABC-2 type transport system permease protein